MKQESTESESDLKVMRVVLVGYMFVAIGLLGYHVYHIFSQPTPPQALDVMAGVVTSGMVAMFIWLAIEILKRAKEWEVKGE